MLWTTLPATLLGALLVATAVADVEWSADRSDPVFRTERGHLVLPARGVRGAALAFAFPPRTEVAPGGYGQWAAIVTLAAGRSEFVFSAADDFTGPTAGYHFLQCLVDGEVVWEQDVAGGGMLPREVRVAVDRPRAGPASLAFRFSQKKLVTNFGVRAWIADVRLAQGDSETVLLGTLDTATPYTPWPEDLALGALLANDEWAKMAGIVQPWGRTQALAVREADRWAPELSERFGLNTIIMLPPEAHNAITAAPDHITAEQFAAAVETYRGAGVRLVLYTSVMHCGHAPAWQLGDIGREHPEWSMRDPSGDTVTAYGQPWLCPSTGARRYTLDYTKALVTRYGAAGVMLDNNQFMHTTSGGATCYCQSCRAAFSDYVLARFGEEGLRTLLGLLPDEVALPTTEDDPLWGLWLAWRKRVWAETLEQFRVELRELDEAIVVLANTQYAYGSWMLAVDRQYPHEDAVLSESRGLAGSSMAAKMLLGRALSAGRPLWNYIGTFDEDDFTRLRPPQDVAALIAASSACGANPWMVFYGFTGDENRPALEAMAEGLAFWRGHVDLLAGGTDRGDIGVLLSPESRDSHGTRLLPAYVEKLLAEGYCMRGLWEPYALHLTDLADLRVLVATTATCLRQTNADTLAQWVRHGGTLVLAPGSGWCDEYGRWRQTNPLAAALATEALTPGTRSLAEGRVVCVDGEDAVPEAIAALCSPRVEATAAVGCHYRSAPDGRRVLSLIGFEGPIGRVRVRLPTGAENPRLTTPEAADVPLETQASNGEALVTVRSDADLVLLIWDG